MREPPIVVSHLDHYFGAGETRIQALFDISLNVARGSLTVLMGPSGSGKTTLLTLMACLRNVHWGSVRLLGTELNGADEEARFGLRRRVGVVFQAHNLHDSLTARQNVLMGLQVHGRGLPADGFKRLILLPPDHDRCARFNDSGFFKRNFGQRVAEPGFMVNRDG